MSSFSNPKKVMIPCRFSFLHCWEPDSVNGSEPKYSVSAIIPKSDTKTVSAIKAAIEVAKQESLPKWGGKISPNLKLPLRDGDIDRPEDEAYAGCYFLNANSREKPQVVDKQVQPIQGVSGPGKLIIYGYANSRLNSFISVKGCSAHICFQNVSLREIRTLNGSNRNPYLIELQMNHHVEMNGCTLDANNVTYDSVYCRTTHPCDRPQQPALCFPRRAGAGSRMAGSFSPRQLDRRYAGTGRRPRQKEI